MKPEQETRSAMQRGGAAAAAAECLVRIFPATFLSLLPPLWLLLFARISAARHRAWVPELESFYTVCAFLKTTSFLGFLIFVTAVAALALRFGGDGCGWLVSVRRRLHGAVVWVLSVQVYLSLWIHCVEEREWSGGEGGGSLRSLVLALGLHETVALWRRRVVKPAVDEAVFAFSEEGNIYSWVEEVGVAAAFGCLWWWRLRREVEELVAVVPVGREVEVVNVVGWLLYGLTAAVGGVRVVKGLLWVANKLLRRSTEKSLPLYYNTNI